jgi:hypothetical protein
MREADWTEPMNVWQRYLISALLPFTISSMIIGTLGLIITTGMVSSKCVFFLHAHPQRTLSTSFKVLCQLGKKYLWYNMGTFNACWVCLVAMIDF